MRPCTNKHHARNHTHRCKDKPTETILPDETACGGIECAETSSTALATNGGVASRDVQVGPIPGRRCDTGMICADLCAPDGPAGKSSSVKSVIRTILVLCAYQLTCVSTNSRSKKRGRCSKIAIDDQLG